MAYNQDITLDLNTLTSYIVVGAKQGDNGRIITATILENGEPFNLSGVSASYRIRKPNGEGSWNSADVYPSTNKVVITLTTIDLSTAGRAFADILLQSGTDRLATVSFIIDVQAAPNIVIPAIESDAFQYLYMMVDNAQTLISDVETWAAGTRGGVEVLRDNYYFSQITGLSFDFDFEQFKTAYNGDFAVLAVGKLYTYKFIYQTNRIDPGPGWVWEEDNRQYDMAELGFSNISYLGSSPEDGNWIVLKASIQDPAWHNNAKWYMEALGNASATAQTAQEGHAAEVNTNYNDENNSYTFNFNVPVPHLTASAQANTVINQPAEAQVEIEQGTHKEGELDSLQKHLKFTFDIPKGVDATFADDATGDLTILEDDETPYVRISQAGPQTSRHFEFEFGIPHGPTGATGAYITDTRIIQNGTDYYFEYKLSDNPNTWHRAQGAMPLRKGDDGENATGTPGVGIANISVNSNYELDFLLTNGQHIVTTGTSVRGPQGQSNKGDPGEPGVGIENIYLDSNYCLHIELTNDTTYVSNSLRGPQGIEGQSGQSGQGQIGAQGPAGKNAVAIQIGTVTEASAGASPSIYAHEPDQDGTVVLDFILPAFAAPSSIIDDTTIAPNLTWSSTKISGELTDLSSDITTLESQVADSSAGLLIRTTTLESNATSMSSSIITLQSQVANPTTGLIAKVSDIQAYESALNSTLATLNSSIGSINSKIGSSEITGTITGNIINIHNQLDGTDGLEDRVQSLEMGMSGKENSLHFDQSNGNLVITHIIQSV